MPPTNSEPVFGLCVTRSGFWHCRPNALPRHAPGDVADYAETFQGATLRLFATPAHDVVVRRLSQTSLAAGVRLASPRFSPEHFQPKDQAQLASQLPNYPSTIGGWRPLNAADATLCALAEAAPVPALRIGIAMHHPAWDLASFVKGLTPTAFADWIEHVRDPRWFVDPAHPEGTTPLEAFLGLRPTTQRDALLRPQKQTGVTARCRATMRCWYDPGADLADPRSFLMRIYSKHIADGRATELAAVRASQAFVRFVRAIWLNAVRPDSQRESVFDPNEFLRDEELAAFLAGAVP